eukprot:5941944-Prymnesium_polylepis.1
MSTRAVTCPPPLVGVARFKGKWERTFWCETLRIPPDAGSLLRMPPLLDGRTLCVAQSAPVKERRRT